MTISIPDGRYALKSVRSDDVIFVEAWNAPSGDLILKTSDSATAKRYTAAAYVRSGQTTVELKKWDRNGYTIDWSTDEMARISRAVKTFAKLDTEQRLVAGERFADTTGRCCICNRTLTKAESVVRGMGPICAERVLGGAAA